MKQNKSNTPIVYRREKNKVEISGDPEQVKKHIWFDQYSRFAFVIAAAILLAIILPKASWLPFVWQWLKRQIPLLILLVVQVILSSG